MRRRPRSTAWSARTARRRRPRSAPRAGRAAPTPARRARRRAPRRAAATTRCRPSPRRAVVVDDALDPLAPDLDLGAVGQDRRVLQRDALLVVEAVGDPALQLLARELAGVHPLMEGMQVVVARSLGAQAGDEVARSQRGLEAIVGDLHAGPDDRFALRRVLEQDRVGVVDVDEDLARPLQPGERLERAAGAESGTWPMSAARRSEMPSTASSSSRQKVPSTSTRSLAAKRARTSSSSRARPGT